MRGWRFCRSQRSSRNAMTWTLYSAIQIDVPPPPARSIEIVDLVAVDLRIEVVLLGPGRVRGIHVSRSSDKPQPRQNLTPPKGRCQLYLAGLVRAPFHRRLHRPSEGGSGTARSTWPSRTVMTSRGDARHHGAVVGVMRMAESLRMVQLLALACAARYWPGCCRTCRGASRQGSIAMNMAANMRRPVSNAHAARIARDWKRPGKKVNPPPAALNQRHW